MKPDPYKKAASRRYQARKLAREGISKYDKHNSKTQIQDKVLPTNSWRYENAAESSLDHDISDDGSYRELKSALNSVKINTSSFKMSEEEVSNFQSLRLDFDRINSILSSSHIDFNTYLIDDETVRKFNLEQKSDLPITFDASVDSKVKLNFPRISPREISKKEVKESKSQPPSSKFDDMPISTVEKDFEQILVEGEISHSSSKNEYSDDDHEKDSQKWLDDLLG